MPKLSLLNCNAIAVGVVLFCLGGASNASAAPGDVRLLIYPGRTSTAGAAINGLGHVSGSSEGKPFRWTAAEGFQSLSYPIYTEPDPRPWYEQPIVAVASGTAISDNGIVAGRWGDQTYGIYRSFISVAGTHTAIPKPADYWPYQTSGVNNSGTVVGSMEHHVGEFGRAWRWTGGAEVQDLGTLGGQQSFGLGINNAGVIVGGASTPSSFHAFRWTESGGMRSIHSLGMSSIANNINDAGVVVGSYQVSLEDDRAFRWSESGGMQTLAMLPGRVSASASDLNESGWILGTQRDAHYRRTQTLWTPDGTAYDLLAWFKQMNPTEGSKWSNITFLQGISDDNIVLGHGTHFDGASGLPMADRTFLLDVSSMVPEPSALTGAATMFLAALRRRPRRTRATPER